MVIFLFILDRSNEIRSFQAHPFDEIQLNDLPPNLILSQEWRIGARPIVSVPSIKKPVTYQSNVPIPTAPVIDMSQQQDKRKRPIDGPAPANGSDSHGIASIVNTFNQTSTNGNDHRSGSIASTQPGVSELVKIYSKATGSKASGSTNGASTNKQNGSNHSFDQISFPKHRQAYEETYEELTVDNLTHG